MLLIWAIILENRLTAAIPATGGRNTWKLPRKGMMEPLFSKGRPKTLQFGNLSQPPRPLF